MLIENRGCVDIISEFTLAKRSVVAGRGLVFLSGCSDEGLWHKYGVLLEEKPNQLRIVLQVFVNDVGISQISVELLDSLVFCIS